MIDKDMLPEEGSVSELLDAMSNVPLKPVQWCYTHGEECSVLQTGDIDMSGPLCEDSLLNQNLNGLSWF